MVNQSVTALTNQSESSKDRARTRTRCSGNPPLRSKKKLFDDHGINVMVSENPFIVTVVTPIMKRANQEKSSGEIIFIDSSGSCDQSGSCVTFVFGSTKSGGIPLGCIIHQLQTQENYTLGFAQLKSVLGPTAFGGSGEPLVIMTDDSSAERNALKSVFPHPSLLLCIFHVLQAMWRWLWDSKHEIANQDRKHLMKLFRSVAYAENEENFEEMVDILMKTDQISEKYPRFKNHCASLLNRKKEWCIAYRSTLRTRGHNTNNIVESSIRVFKDIVLERCKAFNAAALVDFVGNTLEDYHRRRLLKYANVRVSKPELHFQKFCQLSKGLIVQKEKENEYLYYVSSSTDENMFYSVDIENETCDCPAGRGGKFCKHQCAVFLQDDKLKLQNSPNLNFDDRVVLAKLAIGSVDETFFESMNQLEANYDKLSNETQAQDNFDECMVVSTNPNILRLNLDNAPADDNNSIKILEITKNLQDNLNRITTLASESNTLYTHKIMSSLTTKLSSITSSSEALSFLAQVNNKKKGRQIGVQPTSLARIKVGLTLGSKRVQAGRPTENAPPNKKRKRNLASNIDKNKCNSKSH